MGPQPLKAFPAHLAGTGPKTAAYLATLRDFLGWLATVPGGSPFRMELVTEASARAYLDHLAGQGKAPCTRNKALTALRRFCRWAQDEGLLQKNPASQVERPTVTHLAPRELTPEQRLVLKNLVEREGTARMAALFALAYWAGL